MKITRTATCTPLFFDWGYPPTEDLEAGLRVIAEAIAELT